MVLTRLLLLAIATVLVVVYGKNDPPFPPPGPNQTWLVGDLSLSDRLPFCLLQVSYIIMFIYLSIYLSGFFLSICFSPFLNCLGSHLSTLFDCLATATILGARIQKVQRDCNDKIDELETILIDIKEQCHRREIGKCISTSMTT